MPLPDRAVSPRPAIWLPSRRRTAALPASGGHFPEPIRQAPPNDARIASLLDDLDRVRTPTSVSISPDGATIAWAFNGANGSELHLTGLAPAGSRRIGPTASSRPTPSATSPTPPRRLRRLPPRLVARRQAACLPLRLLRQQRKLAAELRRTTSSSGPSATNDIKQVSHLHGAISDLQWSPDGKSIAFLFVENATRHAGALDAMKPWNGVYGEDGVEVQRVAVCSAVDSADYGDFITAGEPPRLRVHLGARFARDRLRRRHTPWRKQLVGRQALHRGSCAAHSRPMSDRMRI